MAMPADGHVHSEWSWDAPLGSMERTCARAVELGLPAVAFTEHADHTAWTVRPEDVGGHEHLLRWVGPSGELTPPRLDAAGYLECVQRCRDRFPDLVVLSGMEVGEPHWHGAAVASLLAAGRFDRVLGSLHCLAIGERYAEPPEMFRHQPAAEAMRDYLAEIVRLITGSDVFAVLAHIDYPVRYWPATAGPFEPAAFEDEFRYALSVLAGTGRALEVNTRVPLHPQIVRWWREEGGDAVAFGSDAHEPLALADGLADAAAMVEAQGFRAGRHPYDVWIRG
ncbi:MAG TPA: PHP domain-containing protein [Mycobacteriales bacterium]|jgi:histidinol-phosphatase (PHP family)|nr:PHP domain-containing protein [Mycobacteriales bacterium]